MSFYRFQNTAQGAEMFIDGPIADATWFGDEITPKAFLSELKKHEGKELTVWINSPGGDVWAASQIYTALKERKGRTVVKIEALAASAASVIAMAGDVVQMSPTAMLMCHNPITGVWGDEQEMKHVIKVLKEVKESIINAYQMKTGLSRDKISDMMNNETWMNANEAVRLGFADKVMYMDTVKNQAPKSMTVNERTYVAQVVAMINNKDPKKTNADIQTEAVLKYLDIISTIY